MKQFGLIGYPLSHSFSRTYFTKKFDEEKLTGYSFVNIEIEHLASLENQLQSLPNLVGINVTIPHKESIIPFCHELDATALTIGAVNCIHIKNNQLIGYNTDIEGFTLSVKPYLKPNYKSALLLGTGGAAKAVKYALEQFGIKAINASRNPSSDQLSYANIKLAEYHVIVNCTPLGMFPNINDFPPIPYEQIGTNHLLVDLTYNPPKTIFIQHGQHAGAVTVNGEEMLKIQAEASWKIWNS